MWILALKFLPFLGSRWAKIALYVIPAIAGIAAGWWLAVQFYKADELDALERQVAAYQKQIATHDKLATEYEQRKASRIKTVVQYVEKDVYRDCKPDADWLLALNQAIIAGNAAR